MASMTLNIAYGQDIASNRLLDVSGKIYTNVELRNGGFIEMDNLYILHLKYRMTKKNIYILYQYHDSPHSSYINVYNRRKFYGKTITIKDIVQKFRKLSIIKTYSTKNKNLKVNFIYDTPNEFFDATDAVIKAYLEWPMSQDAEDGIISDSDDEPCNSDSGRRKHEKPVSFSDSDSDDE